MNEPWSAEQIARRLANTDARLESPGEAARHAAVALVLRPSPDDLEVLFVKRAEIEGDPWSGHMALPGGHRDPADVDLIETARRETLEEVGLDLPREAFLGRLDDLLPVSRSIPSILISPFVAWHEHDVPNRASDEVQYHVWAPLRAFHDPTLRSEVRLTERGQERVLPSILFEGDTIWGLTHSIVMNLLEILTEESGT